MSLVQWGHLTASIATSLLQKGQTLVVGSAGASSGAALPPQPVIREAAIINDKIPAITFLFIVILLSD